MHDLYYWNAEVMVALKMQEMRKEVDSIRLLHEAELSNPNLYVRAAISFGNVLVRLGQCLLKNFTDPHQAYQATSSKFAA